MIAKDAKKLVYSSVASILEGHLMDGAEWLEQDRDGSALPKADVDRMRQATEKLAAELRRRATGS